MEKLEIVLNLREKTISVGGEVLELNSQLVNGRLHNSNSPDYFWGLQFWYRVQEKKEGGPAFEDVEKIFTEKRHTEIEFTNYRKDLISQKSIYNLRIVSKGDEEWREITKDLANMPGIIEFSWEERTVP